MSIQMSIQFGAFTIAIIELGGGWLDGTLRDNGNGGLWCATCGGNAEEMVAYLKAQAEAIMVRHADRF